MAGRYLLSEDDIRVLKQVVNAWRDTIGNTQLRGQISDQSMQTPDVYVARTPSGGISAVTEETGTAIEDHPGSADCDLYRIVETGGDVNLIPLQTTTRTVYNLGNSSIDGDEWILVQKDPFGYWFTSGVISGGSSESGLGITVTDDDTESPSYANTTKIRLDESQGLSYSQSSSNVVDITIEDASTIQNGVVNQTSQILTGHKTFESGLTAKTESYLVPGSGITSVESYNSYWPDESVVIADGSYTGTPAHARVFFAEGPAETGASGGALTLAVSVSEPVITAAIYLVAGTADGSQLVLDVSEIYVTDDSAGNKGDTGTYASPSSVTVKKGLVTSVTAGSGTVDHGTTTGKGDDDHTQYLLLAGRSGGQVAIGGTDSGDDLELQSTSDATKGSIYINGSLKLKENQTSSSITLDQDDNVVLCDSGSDLTITLPAASGNTGLTYYIAKTSTGSSLVTIDPDGAETIDDESSMILYLPYDAVRIYCDGSEWYTIADHRQPHSCLLRRNTARSVPHATTTNALLNEEVYDKGGIGDPTTNNRIDIKRDGIYHIQGGWYLSNALDAGEELWVGIDVNGSTPKWFLLNSGTTNGNVHADVSYFIELSAGDTVALLLYQTEGSTHNTETSSPWMYPYLGLHEIR